jgi:hypothetical protein
MAQCDFKNSVRCVSEIFLTQIRIGNDRKSNCAFLHSPRSLVGGPLALLPRHGMDVSSATKAIVARSANVFLVERNAINLLVSLQEELVQKVAVQKTKLSTQVAMLQQVVHVWDNDVRLVEEAILRIEQTICGLGSQLDAGCVQLDNALRLTKGLATKFIVVGFFESLSTGRVAEAFLQVAEDVIWWTPVGYALSVYKQQMIRRMEGSSRLGMVFCVTEMIAMDSRVAARVSVTGGRKRRFDGFQFLFRFSEGVIVAVRESTDLNPLADLFNS